jgi:hypothetical protein
MTGPGRSNKTPKSLHKHMQIKVLYNNAYDGRPGYTGCLYCGRAEAVMANIDAVVTGSPSPLPAPFSSRR